jgi:nucleoid-associated protein YgaU
VQAGESLYAICKNEYGDTALVTALAKFNKMDDPSQLRSGRRLALPEPEALGGSPRKKVTPRAAPAKPKPPQTYTIQKGDNLSRIAERFLGDKDRWRELHSLNRGIIDDPNNLKVGMVIKLS